MYMKKILTIALTMLSVLFVQAQTKTADIHVDDRLVARLGLEKVEYLRAHNPRQLVVENFNLTAFCFLSKKMTEEEGTYRMMGDLKSVAKPGTTCDYARILEEGCINPYDFKLEQDPYKQSIYTLGNTGAYIVVLSKQRFEENLAAALRQYGL